MESARHPILLLCPLHHDGLCLFKLQAKTLLPLNCLLLGVLLQELEQKLKQLGNQIFFCDVAGLRSLKEGAERKNLSLYPMLANGILGDVSYSNKNWRKKKQKILLLFEEVGIGALQIF